MIKKDSPYIALTGCTFMYYEFLRMLPLLMDPDSEALLRDEVENNRIFQVNSLTSRKRFAKEFKRRYDAVPQRFWEFWQNLSESGQRVGLYFAILNTYRLVQDFHFNVVLKKWNSVDRTLTFADINMEYNELSANNEVVYSWSDFTRKKSCGCFLTMLRQAGLLNSVTNELKHAELEPQEYAYYIQEGEEWFLEACLLYPYEVDNIKSQLLGV